jgi:hypothetical protein
LVCIRTRNPWVLERRRRLGWNVRLGIERIYSLSRSSRLLDERKSINDYCDLSKPRRSLRRNPYRKCALRRASNRGGTPPTRARSETKLHNSRGSYQVAT